MNLYPLLRIVVLASLLLAPPHVAQVREDEMAVGPNIEVADFFRAGIAPVRAPVGYDLTIVYFMDYQCPSCRRYTPDVARVLAEDRKVRVIYRDTPILSDLSTVAARAAIAASFQGRHEAFHHALMMTKGQLTEAGIRAAADIAKVDWARLQRDLKSRGDDIELQISRNVELAVATGILGTPAFIVGDRLSNGALDYASLKAEIADARAAAGTGATTPPGANGTTVGVPSTVEPVPAKVPAAVEAERAATAPPPIFRQADQRPPATAEDARDAGRPMMLAWLAALMAAAVIAVAWWRRRRRARLVSPSFDAT